MAKAPPPTQIDFPVPRPDLVQKAAAAGIDCQIAFDWIVDTEAFRVQEARENAGWTAIAIRELAIEQILAGIPIVCTPETGGEYRDRRHFHYDIVIHGIPEFPRGFYVEMELANRNENDPTVNILNAHPQRAR